jgi:hypothetical protein
MGHRAAAGRGGKARREVGFDQARRPLILIIHHIATCAARGLKKSRRMRIL